MNGTEPIGGACSDGGLPLLGARVENGVARFAVFARPAALCAVRLFPTGGAAPVDHPMHSRGGGYFEAVIADLPPGARYKLVVDGRELPDPYARFLPDGVHGPAMLVENHFDWRSGPGVPRPLCEHVIYELHVGTFSAQGTYDGVRERLPELVALGVTAIELMPLAAFPGSRGWGYEGVALFGPFAPYGTPDELRRLVDEAHGLGLSVFLDVVYNHLGPSGNYLPSFSPEYFTAEYHNAWGDSLNYSHPVVRRMIISNAVYWLEEFRFDGLRLDATHAIVDPSETHILRAIADEVATLEPRKLLIAEDERNDGFLVTEGGLHGLWADDFHHQLRVTITSEQDGYYAAYPPGVERIAQTINQGWLFEGQPFPPTGKRRGRPAKGLEAAAFVYCIQNHDQVGNRALGDRLSDAVTPDDYRAMSTLLLFLPMTPLLFMGQEWACSSPFLFFTDHDPELGRLVFEGRREEFKTFKAFSDPVARAAIPDPQASETFVRSHLKWDERRQGEHAGVLTLYRRLLSLRRTDPVLQVNRRQGLWAGSSGQVLIVTRQTDAGQRILLMNFGDALVEEDSFPAGAAGRSVVLRSDLPEETSNAAAPALPPRTALILGARR